MSVKLSERMLLDGMYPGIVEKWSAEVAGLEKRLEAANQQVVSLVVDYICKGEEPQGEPLLSWYRAALAAGETTHDDYGTTWAALAAGEET